MNCTFLKSVMVQKSGDSLLRRKKSSMFLVHSCINFLPVTLILLLLSLYHMGIQQMQPHHSNDILLRQHLTIIFRYNTKYILKKTKKNQ